MLKKDIKIEKEYKLYTFISINQIATVIAQTNSEDIKEKKTFMNNKILLTIRKIFSKSQSARFL